MVLKFKLYKRKTINPISLESEVVERQIHEEDEDAADAGSQSEQQISPSSTSSVSSASVCREVLLLHQDKFKHYLNLKESAHPRHKRKYEEFLTPDGTNAIFPLFEENSIKYNR